MVRVIDRETRAANAVALGQRIKMHRERAGLSRTDAGRAIGRAYYSIRNVELGSMGYPSIALLSELGALYQTDADELDDWHALAGKFPADLDARWFADLDFRRAVRRLMTGDDAAPIKRPRRRRESGED
jgi:transcriptional regulator with XRE-family HTH domain